MDNESSYNCSFLFSSLVDDHDPDSQDITFSKSEANSNNNSLNNVNSDSKARKKSRNSDGHSDGFNPKKFYVKESKFNQDDDFYISPAALNATTTLEDVLVTKTNIFNQSSELTEINEQCEIFTNDRGTVKLCIDGCLYIKNMKSGNTCYWQCVQKNLKNCHGCAVTYAIGEKHYLKRIRREHTHEPTVFNTRGFSKVYEMQLKNLKENLSDCRFTKNRWGNPKLVIDGYFYYRHTTKKNIFYWKCERRGQCDAYVNTQKNLDGTHKIGQLFKQHSHTPRTETEIKDIRLSYIPKFSQGQLDQMEKDNVIGDNKSDIPNKVQHIEKTSIRNINSSKNIDEGDSSSSMTVSTSNMPKLITLKSSYDQDEHYESDISQATTELVKKSENSLSRQSSQNSISQNSVNAEKPKFKILVKSNSFASNDKKTTKQKLQFKTVGTGEKCEFVFLIDGVYKMLLNGFAYEMIEEYEGKRNAVWRCSGHCSVVVECFAIADTIYFEGDHYLKIIKGKHNHPPCDEDIDEEINTEGGDFEEQEYIFDDPDEYSIDRESRDDRNHEKFQNSMNRNESNNSFDECFDHKSEEEFEGKCEFIVTRRGLPKLTREGYYYVRNSINKNRSEITYWKCELKGRCTGTLVTEAKPDGYYVKSSKGHNHPPDPKKYMEPRYSKPEDVNINFNEADQEHNEDSNEHISIIQDDEPNIKISHYERKGLEKLEDPLANDLSKNKQENLNVTNKLSNTKLKLITTARGMPKIARNGYYYCKSSVNKNRQEITYWKCELKGQCKGFLISITKHDGYYFKSERLHSHPPDPEKYNSVSKSSFDESNNSFASSLSHYNNSSNRYKNNSGPTYSNINSNRKSNFYCYSNQTKNLDSGHINTRNRFESMEQYEEENFMNYSSNTNRLKFQQNESKSLQINKCFDEVPMVPEGGDPSETYECEFIISCQGNPKLCLNGYMYTKNRDKNTNFYWNCEIKKSRRCMGYCVTEVRNGKHIVKKIRAHNHKADLKREMLSKKLSNILQKVYAKPLWNPRKIIDVELARLPDEIRRQLPKAYSIQRMVKRKVQEKVTNVKQNLSNGDYAPIPNMEPSTSRQPQPLQQTKLSNVSDVNQLSERKQSTKQLYNDEYNFNNLYNSHNRTQSHYERNPYNDNYNDGYDTSGNISHSNHSIMNYSNSNNFQSLNNYNQYQETEDSFNYEIKNEPIDDYGYQHFEEDGEEQINLSYDNQTCYEANDANDEESWNNGAFGNSYSNDGIDDNREYLENDNHRFPSPYDSNETSVSSENSARTHNSDEHTVKNNEQERQLSKSFDESKKQPETSNPIVYKKNQIAKKRIRAPVISNN